MPPEGGIRKLRTSRYISYIIEIAYAGSKGLKDSLELGKC